MIAGAVPFGAELLAVLSVVGAGFVLGVGFAIYRAVGWVESMRAWAAGVCEQQEKDGATGLATHEVESGWN